MFAQGLGITPDLPRDPLLGPFRSRQNDDKTLIFLCFLEFPATPIVPRQIDGIAQQVRFQLLVRILLSHGKKTYAFGCVWVWRRAPLRDQTHPSP